MNIILLYAHSYLLQKLPATNGYVSNCSYRFTTVLSTILAVMWQIGLNFSHRGIVRFTSVDIGSSVGRNVLSECHF